MQEPVGRVRLRVFHASPGTPPVEVTLDSSEVVGHLRYGQLSGYTELTPGRYRIRVFPAAAAQQGNELIDDRLERLGSRQDYTVAIVGEPQDLRVVLLNDTVAAFTPGRARVRVFHASPDAPALDVGLAGRPPLFEQVAFTEVTDFREVDAGYVNLELRRNAHPEVIASLPGYTLTGDHIYTLMVLGLVDDEPHITILPVVAPARECLAVR